MAQYLQEKEELTDYVVRPENMIQYPTHAGMTAGVFAGKGVIMYNHFTPTTDFDYVNEIDNPKGLKMVDNIFMCSTTRDDGKANGVMQYFNKMGDITDFDRKRIEALGRLFGGQL